MTFPTTTSDDSKIDPSGTLYDGDSVKKTTNFQGGGVKEGDESDGEGSTRTSAPQIVQTDGSNVERLEDFDETDALDSGDCVLDIIETDASWKEPSEVLVSVTSEESAEFDDKSTVISTGGRKSAKSSKSSGENNGEKSKEKNVEKNGVNDDDVLKPGERFGQFTVVRFVGGGGMGRVYEGVDNELERKVAIKVLPKRRAQDEGIVARFLNEAKSAARLNHENIAQVYLSGNVDGVPYIAFEYVDGINLRDYVRERGVLELNEAIDFVLQAADALAHAAFHGVTHRDVKPSNIIITPQKRAKLIDMGLARLLKDDANDDLTESGVTLGTFDYISPEQARDPRLADVRSDVYSLGCTFYYMLVGAPPFPEGTMLQKLLQHQGDEAPDVREANPKTPVEIASVVKKMMRKNPDERYQTAEALIADLNEISELLGIRVSNAVPANDGAYEKAPSFLWKRFIPGLVATVLLFAFVVVYSFSSRPQMELPGVDLGWNVANMPQVPQNNSVVKETTEKETNDAAQSEQRSSLASNAASSGDVPSEKPNVFQTSLGSGKFGDAVELDNLYSSVWNSSLVVNRASSEEAFSSEEDADVVARRSAFCWNALGEEHNASIKLCANLVADPELSGARSNALRSLGERDVKNAAQETPVSSNLFVVDGIGSAPNSFATLRAALDASTSRDSDATARVELRFNGSISVAPLTLVGKKIEICAGEGFRPSLNFQPSESIDEVGAERLLHLTSSSATIDGVSITFVVPKGRVGSKFTVFETSDASNLTIRNSILTFDGVSDDANFSAATSSTSFFSLTKGETTEDERNAASVDRANKDFVATVRLENVFVRGEATLARIERPGARLEAENSLFNLSGDFFHYVASDSDESDESCFSVNCKRVLVTCGSYFVQLNAENARDSLPRFDVSVANSIIRLQNRPLAFVSSPTPLPEETFWTEWNFKATSALDSVTFCRSSLARDGSIKDYPSPFERGVCETISLDGEAREANKRWESVPPSRLVPAQFAPSILTPLDEATDILPTTRANVKNISELVDALAARFPEESSKE